jgi:hypothetical protein
MMKMIMKKIFEFCTIAIAFLAFYSLIFNTSWRFYPIGFIIGYTLAAAIERILK